MLVQNHATEGFQFESESGLWFNTYLTFQVLNIFIIVKITKSARFRRQFQRHDDDDAEDPHDVDNINLNASIRNRPNLTKFNSTETSPPTINKSPCETPGHQRPSTASLVQVNVTTRGFQPRRTFFKKQQEEHTLGLILIGMSSLFIFCQSFKIIPDLYELVVCTSAGNLGHNCAISKVPVMNVITRMSHLLVCLNSSTNFLIYYLNGEKFRRAWVETYGGWCCCCWSNRRASQASTTIVMQTIRTDIHVESVCIPANGSSGSSERISIDVNGHFLHPSSASRNAKMFKSRTKAKRKMEREFSFSDSCQ